MTTNSPQEITIQRVLSAVTPGTFTASQVRDMPVVLAIAITGARYDPRDRAWE